MCDLVPGTGIYHGTCLRLTFDLGEGGVWSRPLPRTCEVRDTNA